MNPKNKSDRAKFDKAKCIICGQKTVAEGLCEKCYVQKHPLLLRFKEIEVKACPSCSRYFSQGKWKSYNNINAVISELVISSLKVDSGAVDIVTGIRVEELLPDIRARAENCIKGEAATRITGKMANSRVEDHYLIPFKINFRQCEKCSKKNTQYFEATLQLRGKPAVLARASDLAKRLVAKNSQKGVYITKEKPLPGGGGIDFLITSQRFVQWLARKIHEQFGGELSVSSRLFTQDKQTSKRVYRISALLQLPEFSKGEVIFINRGELVKESRHKDLVLKILSSGKKLSCIDLETGKKLALEHPKHDSREKPVILEPRTAVVSSIKPEIHVLHPETYDNVPVMNSEHIKTEHIKSGRKLLPGENVEVVVYNSRVWVI